MDVADGAQDRLLSVMLARSNGKRTRRREEDRGESGESQIQSLNKFSAKQIADECIFSNGRTKRRPCIKEYKQRITI